jgi:hypothetical protein
LKNRIDSQKSYLEKKKFYINTKNGLSNRLRALASAYNIAKATNRQLIVIWIPDFHCEAKFGDLFKLNYLFTGVEFVDEESQINTGSMLEYIICEEDNRYEYLKRDKIIYDYDVNKDKYIDDESPNDIYVSSACVLNNKHTNWLKESFFLRNLEVTDEIAEKIFSFGYDNNIYNAIGIHIRMGQSPETYPHEDISFYCEESKKCVIKWRSHSHWSIFEKEMDKIISENPNQVFFLCCDNEEAYYQLKKLNKYRLIYTEKKLFDRSIEQVKTAIIDIELLSKTKYILGSNWSSFTEIAHRLSGKQLKLAGLDF